MSESTSTNEEESSNARALQEPLLPTTTAPEDDDNDAAACSSFLRAEDKDIVIRGCFPCRRNRRRPQRDPHEWVRLNHNVFLNFTLMIVYGISEGLWGGAVYAAYIKDLYGGKNAPLGKIEALYSIAELVSAVPIGYMADLYGRSKIIRAGSVLFLVTAVLHMVTTYYIANHNGGTGTVGTTIVLMIIMSLWGIGSGIVDGPCEALFADSTPSGAQRDKYYTYLEILYLLATVLGPLLSLVVFAGYKSDEEWSMKPLVTIVYVGLAMEAINAIIMMHFDDDKALEEHGSDSESESESSSSESSSSEEEEEEGNEEEDEEEGNENDNEDTPEARETPEEVEIFLPENDTTTTSSLREKYQWAIPYILLVSELVSASAIGLTDAYFPLYLKDDCGMSFYQVQTLYAVEPIFIAAMTWWAARTAKNFGRIQTIIFFYASATIFFAAIPIFNVRGNHLWLLAFLRIASSSLGDSFRPLEEALLADSLPRNKRARWMSLLSSLSGLHQSATAILGGYLSDIWGYRGTFLATCAGEFLALGFFALLLFLVPERETRRSTTISSSATGNLPQTIPATVSAGAETTTDSSALDQEPLLSSQADQDKDNEEEQQVPN